MNAPAVTKLGSLISMKVSGGSSLMIVECVTCGHEETVSRSSLELIQKWIRCYQGHGPMRVPVNAY